MEVTSYTPGWGPLLPRRAGRGTEKWAGGFLCWEQSVQQGWKSRGNRGLLRELGHPIPPCALVSPVPESLWGRSCWPPSLSPSLRLHTFTSSPRHTSLGAETQTLLSVPGLSKGPKWALCFLSAQGSGPYGRISFSDQMRTHTEAKMEATEPSLCVSLGDFLSVSWPQFPYLYNGQVRDL